MNATISRKQPPRALPETVEQALCGFFEAIESVPSEHRRVVLDSCLCRTRTRYQNTKTGASLRPADYIAITEHAILRYLVRIDGLNLEDTCRAILPEATKKAILEGPPYGKINVGTSHCLVYEPGHVLTVLSVLEGPL